MLVEPVWIHESLSSFQGVVTCILVAIDNHKLILFTPVGIQVPSVIADSLDCKGLLASLETEAIKVSLDPLDSQVCKQFHFILLTKFFYQACVYLSVSWQTVHTFINIY